MLDWAEAVLSNGLGRYEDACAAALRVIEHPQDLGVSNWGMVELVEAAIRCGDYELAGRAHHLLAERARPSGTEWALGVHARSRALLSDGDDVDSLYREAIERLQRTRFRVARDGLSNAAIGARLFISQHTVAYHLRKVFAKLDITSRHQLGAALPS